MKPRMYNELMRLARTVEGLRGPVFRDDFCRDVDNDEVIVDVNERMTIASECYAAYGEVPFEEIDLLDLATVSLDEVLATNEELLDTLYYEQEDEDVAQAYLDAFEPNEFRELVFD